MGPQACGCLRHPSQSSARGAQVTWAVRTVAAGHALLRWAESAGVRFQFVGAPPARPTRASSCRPTAPARAPANAPAFLRSPSCGRAVQQQVPRKGVVGLGHLALCSNLCLCISLQSESL